TFSWGFIDATGINSEQSSVDQGSINSAQGLITFVVANSTLSGAPNGNGNPKPGDVLASPYASTTQLVGAQGTGLLAPIDDGPDNDIGRNFVMQAIQDPFTVDNANINFGELSSGGTKTLSVTGTNNTASAISVSVSSNNSDFTVSPASASVAA